MRRTKSMTLGMIEPVSRENPRRSAWLMACLSIARFAASRTRRSCQGDFAFPHCSGKSSHHAADGMTWARRSLGSAFTVSASDADHQVGDVGLPGLEHREPRRPIGDALDDDALDRRLLAPVLLVGFEHELHAGGHAHESVGPEPDRVLLEGFLPDLLDVLFRYDPCRASGRGGIERQKIPARRLQHETHATPAHPPPRPPPPPAPPARRAP